MDLNVTAITVTNLSASGEGSLCQAFIDAQSSTEQVQITFDPSLAGVITLISDLTIPATAEVTLSDGVSINHKGTDVYNRHYITVRGYCSAEYEEVADAFVSTTSYRGITVEKGGVVDLKNANVNLSGNSSIVLVCGGGSFSMTRGSLYANYSGAIIASGGNMQLSGVEVKNKIENEGTLVLENCTVDNQRIILESACDATITNTSGISTLTINGGSIVNLVGNDFSATTIKLNNFVEGEVIDLSGNYWGTTDLEAIKTKIQGYDESKVLIGTILSEPNAQVFSFDASMLGAHRVSNKSQTLAIIFNALVDAESIQEDSIQLIDSFGVAVKITDYKVEGNKVIISPDSLPTGIYTVSVSSDVKDVRGNFFSVPEGQRKVNFLSLELASPKVIFFRASSTVMDQFRYVDIFFDQEMDASSMTRDKVHIYAQDGTEVAITSITKPGSFFRAHFDKVTEQGTYRIVVDSGVITSDGRPMESDYIKEVYVASPDLMVVDGIEASDTRLGRYTTITYTVQNIGEGEAMGSWTDNIYLCKSEQWDESEAIFFASVTGNDYHVGSGETYTKSARGILDGIVPGTYYVFVKTDMSSRLNEYSEQNNISATGTKLEVSGALNLQNGQKVQEKLSSINEILYAEMSAVQDGTLVFSVNSKDAKVIVRNSSDNSLVKTVAVWDGNEYKYYFPAIAGGKYLVSVKGSKNSSYEVCGDVAGFTLTTISSLSVAAGKAATITVNGACFEYGMQLYLTDSEGNRYEPSTLSVIDACTARVEFTVPDSLPADTELTLWAVNASGETVRFADSLHVADYSLALDVQFNTRMTGEKNIQRVGWIWRTDFTVKNVSGSDLNSPIVLVTDTANDFAMYYSYEDGKARDRSALMFNCGTQTGVAHIMEAGETGKYGVFVKHYRSGSGSIQAWVLEPTSTEVITEERWQQIESALRPASCSDEDWNAWWGNIKPRIGDTEGDFVSFIHEMQSFNTASPQASVADLVEQTMETMPDYVPGYGITGHVYDSQTGEVLSGELLHIYTWDESGNLVHLGSTETDSAGYFYYYGLDDGRSYRVVTDSSADNDRNGISDKGYTDITLNSGSDLEQDFYVVPEMMIGEVSQNSCYQYEDSSTGVKFCSWNRNGTHMVAYGEGADRKEFCISEQYCYGSSLVWSDSLGGMVLVWVEDDRLAYRLLKEDASGLLVSDVVYENVKGGSELSLLDVYTNSDGKLTAILDSASDGGTLILQLTEELLADVALSQLSVSGALLMTEGEGSKEIWSYDSGRNRLLETFGLKFSRVEGNLEVSYTAEENSASAGLSGSFGISYSPLKGHASYKASVKLSFGGNVTANLITGESDDATSGPICIEQRPGANGENPCYVDFSGSTSLGITVSMESRTGLISLLYKIPDPSGITKAIGAGLDALNSLLKAVGYHLYAGYNLSASATYNYDSDSNNKHSCRMEASGGVTLGWQPKPGSKQTAWSSKVMTDLGVNAGFTVNISDFSITDPTFELYGNLSIKTPTYPGVGHLEYDGAIMDLLTGKTNVTFVPDEELENSKTWKLINLVSSSEDKSCWEITKESFLILIGDDDEEEPKPKKITRKQRTVDLFSEGAQITDMKGATLSDNQLCLIASGRVAPSSIAEGEYDMESLNTLLIEQQKQVVLQTFVLDGESGVLSDLNQSALVFESLDLYTAGVQENSQSSASFDITSHIISTDVVSSGGNIYMAWVTFHEGMYYTFSSQLEGDTWQSPLLVAVGQDEVSACYFVESGNRLILAMDSMLTTSTYDTEVYSQQYSLENNSWVDITVYPDESLPEETGASAKKVFRGFLETYDSIKDTLGTLLKCDSIKLAPKKNADASLEHSQFCSYDPNDFYGPNGYGKDNWIAPQEMEFQILCENIPEENVAHTAMVTIKHTVDSAYDYSTFRLGTMVIAGNTIEVEGDVQSYKARLDWTSTLGVWVDVNAQFDAETGEAVWEFIAIDPATGYVVSDPFTGLLAPNYNPPEGDGWVYYYIEPDKTVSTGTSATSKADIYFDFNSPIITPTLTYTFDADAPVAAVQAMAEQSNTRYMRVAWEGSDKGSGIACYNVYVSVDGGNWQLWQEQIAATSALYTVAEGSHTYAFFAQGIDYAGNAELLSEVVESEVVVSSKYEPQQSSLSVASLSADYQGNILTLELTFSEAARCSNWLDALEVVGVSGKLDLSEGAVHYDSSCHTITWMGAVNTLSMGEKLIVRLKNGVVSDASGHYFTSEIPSYSVPVALGAVGQSYAAPTLVDYNGDGLLDLLVGESAGGVGKVRLYLNVGTEQAPEFNDFTYLTSAQDTDLTVIASGCQGAIVRMVDLTGDGEAELLVGLTDGTVRMFTASAEGHWQDAGLLNCSVGGNNDIIYVGSRAAIEFTDFNGDGRTDMLVGTGDGNLVLYLDTATSGATVFDAGQYLHDSAGRIRVGSRASVAVADVDGDGLADLLIGSSSGSILYYRNEGRAGEPLFGEGVQIISGDGVLDLSAETSRLRLSTGDLNGDGVVDIVLGRSDGSVSVLYGTQGATVLGTVQAGAAPEYMIDNVKVTAHGSTLLVSWDALEAEEPGYELSYRLKGDTAATVLKVEGTSTSLTLPDGVYEVSVRGLSGDVNDPWSVAQEVLIDTVAPLSPQSLAATVGEAGLVTLAWTAADGASGYMLRYKETHSATWKTIRLSGKGTETTLYDVPAGVYQWQVCAVDAAGNRSAWSDGDKFSANGAAITETTHWAAGMLFDASGQVIGGYQDMNKVGAEDSHLCWAAAASNVLAWWQQQYPTGSVLNGVPQDAAAIYACFCDNWKNVSGAESYAYTWWLANDSNSFSYNSYYNTNYQGADDIGGWYSEYYGRQNIANHTAQVQLSTLEAADVSSAWEGVYNGGGMLSLGVFNGYSNGALNGGHSLTLWGFTDDAEGYVCEVYVTDSDDDREQLLTLSVAVDEVSGLYRVAEGQGSLSGYYLGTYTYLKAGGMAVDGDAVEKATQLGMASAGDGSGRYTANSLNWVGAGDAVDYYSITAAGDGAYRVGVDTAALETAVQVSVGVLNAQGEFEAQQELLLAPGAALGTLPGVAVEQGQTLYVKVEAVGADSETNGGFYELNISGTVPSAGSGLATQNNRAEEATESAADGSATRGWVGAGDACDFYRVEMESAGSLSLALSELENGARVRIYEQREDGTLAQLDSRAVRAATGLDHTLALTAGSYLVEIASLDNGSGLYNTAYSLTMKKEEEEQNASGMNLA